MTDLVQLKAEARAAAFAARKAAFEARALAHAAGQGAACDHLRGVLAAYGGQVLAGYLPMRTEIDPVPFSTVAIASARRTNPKFEANSQPKPPTPPADTLAERIKAEYLATGPSDRKAIAFVVAVFLLCTVAAFGIPALIR